MRQRVRERQRELGMYDIEREIRERPDPSRRKIARPQVPGLQGPGARLRGAPLAPPCLCPGGAETTVATSWDPSCSPEAGREARSALIEEEPRAAVDARSVLWKEISVNTVAFGA
jgi:hypothetical protein